MNVTVDLTDLRTALTTVKPAVARRSGALPVLSGVRLSAGVGKLSVIATDLDTTIETEIPATTTTEGIAVIAHSLLAPMVKGKGKGTVQIAITDDRAEVTSAGATATLQLLEPADYPILPKPLDGELVELNREALASVTRALSTADERPILTGLYFDGEEMVATDSYRLHIAQVAGAHFPKTLVAGQPLARAAKSKAPVFIRFGDDRVELVSDLGVVKVRTIDGQYPNYRQLIPNPTGMPVRIRVSTSALAAAVRHVKEFCRDSTTPVRLGLAADTLTCSVVNGADGNDASVTVPAVCEGFDVTPQLAVNPVYFLDVLAGGRNDEMEIRAIDHLKPILCVDNDVDVTFARLIMPVRVP